MIVNTRTRVASQNSSNELPANRLPIVSLLALAMAAFICILTESLPAGLLPQIAGRSSLEFNDILENYLYNHRISK